jgi:hypothetical protein
MAAPWNFVDISEVAIWIGCCRSVELRMPLSANENSMVGSKFMDIPNRNGKWLSWSDRIIRRGIAVSIAQVHYAQKAWRRKEPDPSVEKMIEMIRAQVPACSPAPPSRLSVGTELMPDGASIIQHQRDDPDVIVTPA